MPKCVPVLQALEVHAPQAEVERVDQRCASPLAITAGHLQYWGTGRCLKWYCVTIRQQRLRHSSVEQGHGWQRWPRTKHEVQPSRRSAWGAWTSSGRAMMTGRAGWAARGPPCCLQPKVLTKRLLVQVLVLLAASSKKLSNGQITSTNVYVQVEGITRRDPLAKAFCRPTSFCKDVPASHRDPAILLVSIRPGNANRKISLERQQVFNSGRASAAARLDLASELGCIYKEHI